MLDPKGDKTFLWNYMMSWKWTLLQLFLFYVCVLPACLNLYLVRACALGDENKALDVLELKLQGVFSCLVWVWRPEPVSSVRTSPLNCQAIFLVLEREFLTPVLLSFALVVKSLNGMSESHFCLFLNRVPCNPDRSWTHCKAKDDIKLLLLPQCLKYWDYRPHTITYSS